MAQWNIRTMTETEIKGYQVGLLTSRFSNVQFANNRSRFANVLGSFAVVLFASNRIRGSM